MKNLKKVFTVITLLAVFTVFSQHTAHIKVKASSETSSYYTDFYFNDNASDALDPGYDARIFESTPLPFSLYSLLVDDTGYEGLPLAVQSLNSSAINDATISLGVNAYKDKILIFEIVESDLTSATKIFIIDALTGDETLLTGTYSYSLSSNVDIKGAGRFYLRFEGDVVIPDPEPPTEPPVYEMMDVNVSYKRGSLIIKGDIPADTHLHFYYKNALIREAILSAKKRQTIKIGGLMAGEYIIELLGGNKQATLKLTIR